VSSMEVKYDSEDHYDSFPSSLEKRSPSNL